MPPCPGGLVGVTLCCYLRGYGTVGIVADDVVATVIGAEMIFQGIVGVSYGDVLKLFIARFFGRPKQKFQVHHVVDNHRLSEILKRIP